MIRKFFVTAALCACAVSPSAYAVPGKRLGNQMSEFVISVQPAVPDCVLFR